VAGEQERDVVKPAVTVLMSVHNDLRFLPESVESILGQTFKAFEFFIIDDGSTDGSSDYLRGLKDPRVKVFRNEQNLGLTRSLNRGLDMIGTDYIARMDADDVAMPTRLAEQVRFLDRNPDVGLLGSSRLLIDESGKEIRMAQAWEKDVAIRFRCLLGNPFAHPAVMIRREVLQTHGLRYDESFRTAQDYELWTRMLAATKGANLAGPLIKYRIRQGISATLKPEQLANHVRIALQAMRTILPVYEIGEDEVRKLRGRYGGASVREAWMNARDKQWANKYREVLEEFLKRYPVDKDMDEILRGFVERSIFGA
jgi:glycosyltransferase involved in cell wall biosynthesis